ncbi:MAG TPA: hypothetical protein VFZ04_01635 [Longimicrobiales bacterium]
MADQVNVSQPSGNGGGSGGVWAVVVIVILLIVGALLFFRGGLGDRDTDIDVQIEAPAGGDQGGGGNQGGGTQ